MPSLSTDVRLEGDGRALVGWLHVPLRFALAFVVAVVVVGVRIVLSES